MTTRPLTLGAAALLAAFAIAPLATAETTAVNEPTLGDWTGSHDAPCPPAFCTACEQLGGRCVYVTGLPCLCIFIIES